MAEKRELYHDECIPDREDVLTVTTGVEERGEYIAFRINKRYDDLVALYNKDEVRRLRNQLNTYLGE